MTITNPSNNTYSIENENGFSIYVEVEKLNDAGGWDLIETTADILEDAFSELTLADGFYRLAERRVSNDSLVSYYFVPVYVSVQESLLAISLRLVEALSCVDFTCDCATLYPKELYLQHCYNIGLHLSYMYFTLINKIMADNYMFTVATGELNADILQLSLWKAALDRYLYNIVDSYGIS